MDEKIFVREQENNQNKSINPMIIIGVAVILILIGIVGIFGVVNSNSSTNEAVSSNDSNQESTETITDEVNEPDLAADETTNDEDSNINEVDESNEVATNQEDETSSENQSTTETPVSFEPPADDSKYNVYYVKNGSLTPVVKNKPADKLTTQIIIDVVTGPTSKDIENGFSDEWNFVGISNCGDSTFQWAGNGSNIEITLCKEISANNPNLFKEALKQSLIEQTNFTNLIVINPDGSRL